MAPKKSTGNDADAEAPQKAIDGEVVLPAAMVADPLDDPARWPPEPEEQALPGDLALEEAINAVDSMKQWLSMRYRVYRAGARYNPTERDRLNVLYMTWAGFPKERIARYVGMNKETLLNHFAYELEHGRDGMITDVVKAVVLKAKGGDLTAAKLILTNRAADLWDDKRGVPQVNVSVDATAPATGERSPEDVERVVKMLTDRVLAEVKEKKP